MISLETMHTSFKMSNIMVLAFLKIKALK